MLIPKPEGAQQSQINIDCARAVESAARSRSRRTNCIGVKEAGVEILQPIAGIAVQCEPAGGVVRKIDTLIVHAIGTAAQQRPVAVTGDGNREAGTGAGYSGDGPSLRQPGWNPTRPAGQLVVEGCHQIVRQVPC